MTDKDNQDQNKGKKLTLGGSSKLTLNKNFAGRLGAGAQSGGPSKVVVEVKKGLSNAGMFSLNKSASLNRSDSSEEDKRRLAALQKSKTDSNTENPNENIGSLAKIREINKENDVEEKIDITLEEASESESQETFEENIQEETIKPSEDEPSSPEAKPVESKTLGINRLRGTVVNYTVNRRASPKDLTVGAPESKEAESLKPKLEHKKVYGPTTTTASNFEEKEVAEAPKKQQNAPKKVKKSDLLKFIDEEDGDAPIKTRSLASIRRAKLKEQRKSGNIVQKDKVYREVIVGDTISVGELASRMSERAADVIRELMKLGIIASTVQVIDADTAQIVAEVLGHKVKRVQESDIEKMFDETEDSLELGVRAPIVTVMGHVDHGKTSLLDALKSTDVASREAGGITQHIGAYSVTLENGKIITFIDTPGHEAFTQMRTRGAKVTDIVVLVVAADDGIKAQTVEAISHAKAAGVPIIVAINKIDKPDADIEKVRNELLVHELVPEELGGDIITVPVSAMKKTNLDKLEDAILLVAEMQELKANPRKKAAGVVIESRLDKGSGAVATIIVQNGTLFKGDLVVAGTTFGRIRNITNDKGKSVLEAGPSIAVEIWGLTDAPLAGDVFNVAETDKQAREITEYRAKKSKNSKITAAKTSLEDLFIRAANDGSIKELPLIIKADTQGSIEAIVGSLEKIESNEVKLKILHSGVGAITDSDTTLAGATGAIIVGFNVRSASSMDEQADIRYYSIIYNLIDDIKAVMSGMLAPIIRESYIGSVDIRDVFNVSKVGKVAGSYVTKGIIKRGSGVRLLRDNIVIHEGKLKTLKRFKDDVKEVKEGFECGIAFENYDDIKVGDKVEVFEIIEEKQKL